MTDGSGIKDVKFIHSEQTINEPELKSGRTILESLLRDILKVRDEVLLTADNNMKTGNVV